VAVNPDNDAALDFLQRWSPEGPWALTAIKPDKKSIQGKLFHKADFTEMGKWIKERNGKYNMYFSVNTVMRDFDRKASREDIKSMDWLHIDIDARPPNPELSPEEVAAHTKAEFVRIYELLTKKLPQGIPEPSVITYSGGGYQAFWKLQEPVAIDGDTAKYEDAKLYNVQLERIFEGDNCHNVDRIMRLPGTVNLPDAKKLKKGRKPALAVVKKFAGDIAYPLTAFIKAAPVQMSNDKGFTGGGGGVEDTIKVGGNIERIADVSELDKWEVPERVKVIIVQGHHPEETKEDNSRSSWLFDVICNLYRKNVPDEVIYAIITDKDYGISASVIDKGSNIEKYALRQMARAKEEAIDPWLRKLNERHAVISNIGGKCRIIEEVVDMSFKGRTRLTRQSFDDFRNRYMNQFVRVGTDSENKPVWMAAGKWWLGHTGRRQFDTIVFSPEREIPGTYNLWRGFAFQQKPGDCQLFLDHLEKNVCQGKREHYAYLIKWMARAVQQPASPGEVAVVLRGGRGTGKGKTAKVFGALFGRHFLHISNSSHLVGNFNSHLRDCVVLFADEAFYAGDKKHRSILNTLITEETIAIEAKGIDVDIFPNYIHLIMSSNDQHVIPAGGDERRYFVIDVSNDQQQNAAYFAAIDKQMDSGGYEALLHMLMTTDIKDFNVRLVPQTTALQEQKLLSLNVEEEWWYQKLEEGRLLRHGATNDWMVQVRKDALVDDYIEYTRRFNVTRRGNQTALGRFLQRVCPKLSSMQQMTEWDEPTKDGWTRKVKGRAYFWELPTLEAARERWVGLYGETDWPAYEPLQTTLPTAEKPPF
jgi:hypothetical protein